MVVFWTSKAMQCARLFVVLVIGSPLFSSAAIAQSCGLSLVLAIDVSSSVDEEEYRLQMHGMAGALSDAEVVQAIGLVGGIQLLAFEWSGRYDQTDIFPWRFVAFEEDVITVANEIRNHPRVRSDMPTALGYALGYASRRLDEAPLLCGRKVVDVSGDGITNEGFEPYHAYAAFPLQDVQVNGLVIRGAEPDPVEYYEDEVKQGPGSFIEIASGFSDYQRAMKRKLLREILGGALSEVHTGHGGSISILR
ncbi:MAG: DUF1194 domain-containing protein [Pseudomonadota bacterium]